ncbi:YbjN domain-containing protein [Spirulina sp. CCNP1310]|uniref:YbjN domain-containing protein n=1 Tax=Spirulina sp. CCNP1310 TaxID=3110249 RepID=UPI002B1ED726|nr:YbjN domain-containing protein [Spirulina sp. CCNP1310]MEA5419673.1 YbjN domain-containing protein [Spirulina sp. CCNP1310]
MLLESTVSILKKQEWQFYELGNSTIRLDVNGQAATWSTMVKCIDEHQQIIVYSICPNKARVDKLIAIQEFLTRANFGLKFGNFEMDLSDGEVRFKTSIQFAGMVEPEAMIEECLSLNIVTFDRYLPGILQVMFTDVTPEDAIAVIESPNVETSTQV